MACHRQNNVSEGKGRNPRQFVAQQLIELASRRGRDDMVLYQHVSAGGRSSTGLRAASRAATPSVKGSYRPFRRTDAAMSCVPSTSMMMPSRPRMALLVQALGSNSANRVNHHEKKLASMRCDLSVGSINRAGLKSNRECERSRLAVRFQAARSAKSGRRTGLAGQPCTISTSYQSVSGLVRFSLYAGWYQAIVPFSP